MAMAERGGARLLLRRRRRPRRSENGAGGDSGGRWRDEGAPRRIVAWLGRAEATRGRRRGHAARGFCRWSATERVVQFISEPVQCLTTSFVADFSANPSLQRANSLHRNDRPMYQLQLLFKDRVPILNVNWVKSSPR